ncbi:MAG TPA: polyprenyl synthetase family protein [Prolixibacteraceae bacterium]|nr:polyprenyl synthetase family protein [Prolixibacteraceae bacterium]
MDNQLLEKKLSVPSARELRMSVQTKAREVVFRRKVQPPAGIELIETLGREVISDLEIDPVYLEFAMVNCGNEIWRPVVEAVPFDRRLLLLPQCLRNRESCKAITDEFGLLCAGCKQCNIDELIELAASLGYTTLVAEGTTMAVSLIEEGAVDAVIGVSCMETLQKSFNPVALSGVPVMGIPLLSNGCVDTQVDLKWLKQEIASHHCCEQLVPVSLSKLKDHLERLFTREQLSTYFLSGDRTSEFALQSILDGGHRMRPLLTLLAYSAYAVCYAEPVADSLAFVIECFHKASLIHDDIEDHDDSRYQKKTLHVREGIEVAINVGDLLVGKGYQVLAGLNLEPSKLSQILLVLANAHVDSALGQGNDLLQSRDGQVLPTEKLLKVFSLKTGSAIKVSLLLGAIAGGASQADLESLSIFANYFGIAYQIGDDLQEFQHETGVLNPSDFPFLLSRLQHHSLSLTPDNLRELIIQFEIEKEAENYLNDYITRAYQSMNALSNLKMRLGLLVMMGAFFKR